MSDDMTIEDAIKHNIETVLRVLDANQVENDYGMGALRWLETYAEQHRPHLTDQGINTLVAGIGSFLGDCMCRAYNGVWVEHNGSWGVSFDDDKIMLAFPFTKVHKFLINGPEDSFVSMFNSTSGLLEYFREKNASKEDDS